MDANERDDAVEARFEFLAQVCDEVLIGAAGGGWRVRLRRAGGETLEAIGPSPLDAVAAAVTAARARGWTAPA